jgi:FkbM family methyltransferase
MVKIMNKIFIDCGTNLCQGLNDILNKHNIDNTWKVYSFEANPITYSKINKSKFENVTFINKAVWIENCKRNLNVEIVPGKLDNHHNKFLIDKEECNMLVGGATNIMDDNFQYPNSDFYLKDKEVVDCIDISEFISKFDVNDYIIMKLDVEGAEYPILEKMIENKTIGYINELYVEWHNHMLKNKFNQNSIIENIYRNNIILHPWY